MLATLVIGLREGLEAALIVGIIAAFLRKNGKSLAPMWIGVVAAVVLSLTIGIVLHVVVDDLPQRPQEALETVIGVVAVVFVTTMVLWMTTHARFMRRELEASAGSALGSGGARALAAMAFLAVLKEGFETAVFLLATFQHSTDTLAAATGAVVGILAACLIGIGLYTGGVSLNLGRFFKATSVFLILVAAGLVVTAVGTAHEAGWINGGQGATVDLSWLAPGGDSIQGALVTGVLGIPPHPVAIQVLAWLAYAVPMVLVLFWPTRHRLTTARGLTVRWAVAAVLVVGAAALPLLVPTPQVAAPASMPLVTGSGARVGTATSTDGAFSITMGETPMTAQLTSGLSGDHAGVADTEHFAVTVTAAGTALPASLALTDLVALAGGRIPVGIDARRSPGPFAASWARVATADVWTADGAVLDATGKDALVLTLSDGGLAAPRTVTVDPGATLPGGGLAPGGSFQADPAAVIAFADELQAHGGHLADARLYGRLLPLALLIAAALVALRAENIRRRLRRAAGPPAAPTPVAAAGHAVT